MLLTASDITVYYRSEDELVVTRLVHDLLKLKPSVKVETRVSSMVPEGQCIFIRNDARVFDINQPYLPNIVTTNHDCL